MCVRVVYSICVVYSMCMCVSNILWCLFRSQRTACRSLSFYPVDSRTGTQVIRFGNMHLYPLSYSAGSMISTVTDWNPASCLCGVGWGGVEVSLASPCAQMWELRQSECVTCSLGSLKLAWLWDRGTESGSQAASLFPLLEVPDLASGHLRREPLGLLP